MTTDDYADIRRLLATAPLIEPGPGVLERIVAAVAAADAEVEDGARPAPAVVVDLEARRSARIQRWAPRVAAAAAVVVIVGSVVGGVGGDTRIPAIGDMVSRHDAAASETMPAAAEVMSIDAAHDMEPAMPTSMEMTDAFHTSDAVHLVYRDGYGGFVSVFRQDGDTDLYEMEYGSVEMMGDSRVWTAEVDGVHVAVVDGDGYVWTIVADHHDSAMMATMTDDMPTRSPSLLDRARDAADALVDPWRLGI